MSRRGVSLAFFLGLLVTHNFLATVPAKAGFMDDMKKAAGKAREGAKKARDRAREAGEKAREKWKEKEHRCTDCGKVIHLGKRCTGCEARYRKKQLRQQTERLEKAKDSVRKRWKEAERRCVDCRKVIHLGKRCASCETKRLAAKGRRTASRVKTKWREMEHSCRSCRKPIHVGTYCSTCMRKMSMDRIRESRIRERCAEAMSKLRSNMSDCYRQARYQYGPQVMATVRDPEVQREVFETVGMVARVNRRIREERNRVTYKALQSLGELPVETNAGRMTLEDAFRRKLLKEFPGADGTDLMGDPAKVIAYGVLGRDKSYLFGELKVIKKEGRAVSVKTALAESSPLDVDSTMRLLTIAESCEKITSDGASTGDIAESVDTLHSELRGFRDRD